MQRNFIIGDSWLYYKLYTGYKTADKIIVKIINPFAQELIKNNYIDQWFFIRYADPENHLRVRFHCTHPLHLPIIINKLNKPLKEYMNKELLWKVQVDTYQRELERYGKNTIELSENIFFYDSKMVASFINLIVNDEGEEMRWLFGLRAIENILNTFQYSDIEKLNLVETLKTNFGKEFSMSRPLKKQLDIKYRNSKEKIYYFMTFTKDINSNLLSILNILNTFFSDSQNVAFKILHYRKEGMSQKELNDLISSYIHMLMNRLFKSNNRLQEMVCYDFLYRYYKSGWARKKCQN